MAMYSFRILLLLLTLTFAAASSPSRRHHRFHFTENTADPHHELLEITRPLASDSLSPACTIPVFSGTFGNTAGRLPSRTSYSPPLRCSWSKVVLHLSAAAAGPQYCRIAAVWLSGAEILRTSTPKPTHNGVFWNVRKDITRFSPLLRQRKRILSVMLENQVNEALSGVYQLNLTFLYYDINHSGSDGDSFLSPLPLFSGYTEDLLNLDKNPADLITPITSTGERGFWFRIEDESDVKLKNIKIPLNTYRAVIEVCVSSHENDEVWYSNPPDAYIAMNGLQTNRGHGSYREVLVTIDGNVVASLIPFPVIYAGGINPLFWDPIVSIGAFTLPCYEIELTPFLGKLLDGETHSFGFSVIDSISFWLVGSNLHQWMDKNAYKVEARTAIYSNPSKPIQRKFKFDKLDGKFETDGERKSELLGWVNSSAGNFTTHVSIKSEIENKIKFMKNGTRKIVDHEIRVKNQFKFISDNGTLLIDSSVYRKYPLSLTMSSTRPGSEQDAYLKTIKLEHSMKEEKWKGNITLSNLSNAQKSEGWMVVKDENVVVSGVASTQQKYAVQDGGGCYTRLVAAAGGYIKSDMESDVCTVDS